MRAGRRLFVATTGFMLASTVVMANPAATKPQSSGPKTTHTSSKPTTSTTAKSHGSSGKTTSSTTKTKSTPPGKSKNTPSSTSVTNTSTTSPADTSSTSTSTSSSSTTTTWTPNNPVAQKLSTKPNLLNKVKTSLPVGTDLNAATAGFKNFGQFLAATNVSKNLSIDFGKLKAAMTGTTLAGTSTGKPVESLGQAIQQLKPGVNADAEAAKAESQANADIAANGGL